MTPTPTTAQASTPPSARSTTIMTPPPELDIKASASPSSDGDSADEVKPIPSDDENTSPSKKAKVSKAKAKVTKREPGTSAAGGKKWTGTEDWMLFLGTHPKAKGVDWAGLGAALGRDAKVGPLVHGVILLFPPCGCYSAVLAWHLSVYTMTILIPSRARTVIR